MLLNFANLGKTQHQTGSVIGVSKNLDQPRKEI